MSAGGPLGTTGGPPWVFTPSELARSRAEARRRAGARSTRVALVSTLAFAGATYLLVTSAPGWDRTSATFFDWSYGLEVLPELLEGLWLNLRVLVVAALGALGLGLLLAVLRTTRGPVTLPLRVAATAYTDLFRGLPLLVVLYVVGLGVPSLRLQGVPTGAAVLGTVALVLTYAAYVGEVLRAGVEAVHPSQRAAARSLGLTSRQTMRLVVLPQALRKVAPPLLNDFVALQKDVGLISVLGAVDAIRKAQIEVAVTFDFTPYVVVGLLFVALAVPTARVADAVAARAVRREQQGSVV